MGYFVRLTRDDDGSLLVTCDDLPEVTSFGESEPDALVHGRDAILTAIMGRIRHRQDVPAPRSREGIYVSLPALAEAKLVLYRAFFDAKLTKAELARRLGWNAPSVDRLFELDHDSRLGQLEMAAKAIRPGGELRISLEAA